MESVTRFFSPVEGSFFLLGPRGTGKSWWTRRAFPDALVIDLLDPATARQLAARPERLEAILDGQPHPGPVVVDEVQRVPELLNVVHRLIERKHGWRFVLTGSSARKLRRGGVNLLGGRASLESFFPWMAAELGARFSLASALERGLVPSVLAAADPDAALAAYAGVYVREEVQAERLVRDVGDFSRFLEALSFSHAAELNVANVARECQVERKTVESFVTIAEDLLLATRLNVFARRAKRALTAHPKFYFFDAGVFRSLRPAGPLDRRDEADGAALEGLVFQHLRTWAAWNSRAKRQLHFWRTRSGHEVDFVIYAKDEFVALEVKNTRSPRDADLKSLVRFREDYPEATAILLHRGTERTRERGVWCIPVEPFLARLRPSGTLASAARIRDGQGDPANGD